MISSSYGYLDHQDWLEQLYHPPDTPPASAEFVNSAAGTTSSTASMGSPKRHLSKPRRRSRASKKTPTTILNANANNFRSLVQQFTGRPKSSPDTFPFGVHRGPVNLNFSNYREEDNPVAPHYSHRSNYGLVSGSLTSYAFPDQLQLPRNSSGQGLGRRGMSSFNSYTTASTNLDGGVVSGSGGSWVAQQEEFDQFPVEGLPDLARVSEGLSYSSRDYW